MRKLPYQLTDKLFVLGQDLFLTYLIKGEPCTLLDMGTSGTVPLIEQQLKELGVEANDIGHLVVLHAHWDHICGLPYMQRMFPKATVWSSAKARDVLSKPKIVDLFRRNDEKYCTRLMNMGVFEKLPESLSYDTMNIDRVIEDGQTLSLGGTDIRFLLTPGHSPDTLSAYIPSEKTTIISDAIGCYDPVTDEYLALFFQGMQLTLASVDILEALDSDIVGYCHDPEMIFIGKEAIRKSYQRIREELMKLKQEIEEMEKKGSSEEAMIDMLFRASYRGFLKQMYPPEYIKAVAPLLLKAMKN